MFLRNRKGAQTRGAACNKGLPFADALRNPYGLSQEGAMKLATFYACVDVISTDVAKLPFEPYALDAQGRRVKALTNPSYQLLNMIPNEGTTRFTLFQCLVASMLLHGDGFASIERDPRTGLAQSIHFERYHDVSVFYRPPGDGGGIAYYRSARTGKTYEPNDMIHILNFSYDGLRGVGVIRHAAQVLGVSIASDEQAGAYVTAGGAVTGLLTVERPKLRKEDKEEILNEWGEVTRRGVGVLGGDTRYTSLSVNPKDAQLLESRQFNVVEICRFFRISPVKIGDLTKSSYSTVEATQLAYLTDTLSTHLAKIELEFWRKVYPPKMRAQMRVAFDPSALLRADTSSLSAMLTQMMGGGAMTINEARQLLNLAPIEGGDEPLIMLNMTKLSALGNMSAPGNGEEVQSIKQ